MADWTLTKQSGAGAYHATVTAHASSANTKGDYVQLAASTGAAGFYLLLRNASATALQFLVDIATGAESSETVVLANVHFSQGGAGRAAALFVYVPLRIAAASRLSVRCQCSVAASTLDVALYTVSARNDLPVFGRATTYGAETADSGGTQVDPGATADTEGASSELSASTTNDMAYALLCFGNQANTADTDSHLLVDVVTGASLNVEALTNLPLHASAALDGKFPPAYGLPLVIASGTRLGVRAQCSTNNAADRLFDVVMIGFDQPETSASGTARRPRARGHGV
jgi:hypothetical protein